MSGEHLAGQPARPGVAEAVCRGRAGNVYGGDVAEVGEATSNSTDARAVAVASFIKAAGIADLPDSRFITALGDGAASLRVLACHVRTNDSGVIFMGWGYGRRLEIAAAT